MLPDAARVATLVDRLIHRAEVIDLEAEARAATRHGVPSAVRLLGVDRCATGRLGRHLWARGVATDAFARRGLRGGWCILGGGTGLGLWLCGRRGIGRVGGHERLASTKRAGRLSSGAQRGIRVAGRFGSAALPSYQRLIP